MPLPRVSAFAALVSLAGGASAQAAADPRLHTVFGAVDPLDGLADVPPALAAPADGRLFVVQFATAIQPAYARALAARRLSVVAYLPANAYVVRGARADAEAFRALPPAGSPVRWVGPLPLAWKLAKALQPLAMAPAAGGDAIVCNLLLADKADEAPLCAQIRSLGGEVVVHGPVLVRARLRPLPLRAVAALDGVL
ncbi:MAG TPA: hypothetical protein VFA35_05720, partial [Burkholderiaceae bacterium]|nr:hypothetical protein [Burkholderiaceae bacterium]